VAVGDGKPLPGIRVRVRAPEPSVSPPPSPPRPQARSRTAAEPATGLGSSETSTPREAGGSTATGDVDSVREGAAEPFAMYGIRPFGNENFATPPAVRAHCPHGPMGFRRRRTQTMKATNSSAKLSRSFLVHGLTTPRPPEGRSREQRPTSNGFADGRPRRAPSIKRTPAKFGPRDRPRPIPGGEPCPPDQGLVTRATGCEWGGGRP